ncbi:MAG: hypothetical protein IIU08_03050 [Clostridia bacterium]|nr:hypothetical protein [Clostridia bacterium]
MSKFDFIVETKDDLVRAVREFGFVPLFCNSVPGFSVEEHVSPKAWFSGGEGVWEWKGPVIRETGCAYGKFFEKKAVFISKEWFPDFANYRRDGYDFDARFDDGLASFRDRDLYELLDSHAPILSKDLKALSAVKGFDTVLSRLQAQCYAVISDFVYETSRAGVPYGWGVAQYSTPEKFMGGDFASAVYRHTPEESCRRVFGHLRELLPDAGDEAIRKILK